ncbi:DUF190 domain-containing protein [Ferrimicrobium sp.]|uniref:DUF190 domain-containing protein n=1 Tax=Ferrimicrobium sp. TaxID=2926050 RepID=UPI002606F24F|nr:DUF190 domain-containing protein [Ferrimicrobium sp.]
MNIDILIIFVNESDRIHHHSSADFIIQQALELGLSGASTFRAIDGFGNHHHLHPQTLLSMTDDEGVAIVVTDTPTKVDLLLESLSGVGIKAFTLRVPATRQVLE